MQVSIYTTSTCPYCKLVKAFFVEHGIQFTERDVTSDAVAQQEMIVKSGVMAVPVIDVDGTIVVGFKELELKQLLHLS